MTKHLYSKDHQWVLVENRRARIGLSDFAQAELGEIAYVELPQPGKTVKKDDVICSLDSLKSSSEIYAPVSGKVVEVNERLTGEGNCSIINYDPLGEGWLFVIEMSNPEELSSLLSEEEYRRYTE